MADFGSMMGFGWSGMLFWVITWGLFIALVVWALGRLLPQSPRREDPRDALKWRYAAGT